MAQPFEQLLSNIKNNTDKMSETLSAVKSSTEKTREISVSALRQSQQLERSKKVETSRDKADLISEAPGGTPLPESISEDLDNIASLLEDINESLGSVGGNGGLGSGSDGLLNGLVSGITQGITKALPLALAGAKFTLPLAAAGGIGAFLLNKLQEMGRNLSGVDENGNQTKTSVSQELQFGESADVVASIQRDQGKSKAPFKRDRGGMKNEYRQRGGNETAMQQGFTTPEQQDSQRQVYVKLFEDLENEKNDKIKEITTTRKSGKGRSQKTIVIVDEDKKEIILKDYETKKNKIIERYEETFGPLSRDILRRRTGGIIQVPGSSTGDNHNMLLPEGSFVLNREASKFLTRQSGGLIPTKTESKELIFPPGKWDKSISALNSAIPRFQSGGLVSHDQTGEGYNPNGGKDSQGRPVVFSKEAASTFAKMMADGGVNPKDVTSSKRSPAHNERVGGVANSNHLSGNAVDIHGLSKMWMKQNGSEYGWKWLDYSGHDGHFDFIKGTGGGANSSGGDASVKEGNETGVKDESSSNPVSELLSQSKSLMSGVGYDKESGQFSGIGDVMKGLTGSIAGILSGGGMGMLALLGGGGGSIASSLLGAGGGLLGSLMGGSGDQSTSNSTTTSPVSSGGGSTGSNVFDLITEGEGGLNSVNQGVSGDTPGGAKSIFGKNLTDMTVAEIQQAQQAGKVFAVGKYQIIPKTMSGFVSDTGLDTSRKFDNSTQELFKDYVINQKRPAVGSYLNGNGSIEEAGQALAREFASVGLQYEEAGRPRGSSRYAGKGGNAASITPDEMLSALKKDKKGFQSGGMVGGLQPAKVESGEMIFPPGSFGKEIPDLNSAIPRFKSGGMIDSANIKANPSTNMQNFIAKRFQSISQSTDMSQTQSGGQPTIIPVPMPMGGQSESSGEAGGSAIPSLTSSPSNHIVSTLMMSSYSLMRNIG